jgi:serine/threonine-protein phosphatase 5
LQNEDTKVTVVGDTHGQFHDVCNLFTIAGLPGPNNRFVFNGDFIDRGAWGLETLALLCAWKLAAPDHFTMLRGNHESATCTQCYGYKNELKAKYGKSKWQSVYTACKRLFAVIPLAALIQQKTLVLHGGLFRRPIQRRPAPAALLPAAASGKRKRTVPVHSKKQTSNGISLGSIDDLRGKDTSKGGQDPSGYGAGQLAADIMWSDPVMDPGFEENLARGIGMAFGPDVTERFLKENSLSLILRSHEGPDARDDRDDMKPMSEGWTLDHDTPAGKLYTVFSAPDYPQFIHPDLDRYKNKAAVAVLTRERGDYTDPEMMSYEAVHPRPAAEPYYDLAVPDSDEEWEPAASDASGMTDVVREGKDGEEVEGAEEEVVRVEAALEEEEEQEDDDSKGPAKKQKKGEEDEDYVPPPFSSSKSVLLAEVEMQVGEEDDVAVIVMDHNAAADSNDDGIILDPPAAVVVEDEDEEEEEEEEGRIVLIIQEKEEVVVEEEVVMQVVAVAPSSSLPPKSTEKSALEEQTEKEEEEEVGVAVEKVASPHEVETVVEAVEEQVVEVEKNTKDANGGDNTVDEGKAAAEQVKEMPTIVACDIGDNKPDEKQQRQLPMASSPLSERHQQKSSSSLKDTSGATPASIASAAAAGGGGASQEKEMSATAAATPARSLTAMDIMSPARRTTGLIPISRPSVSKENGPVGNLSE